MKNKKLISLKEFNGLNTYPYTSIYPMHNGISCPECGKELYDTDSMILTSCPPQRNIHCDCGYKGYRKA